MQPVQQLHHLTWLYQNLGATENLQVDWTNPKLACIFPLV